MSTTSLIGGISFVSSLDNPSRVTVKLEWRDYVVDTAEKGKEVTTILNQFFSDLNEDFHVEYTSFPSQLSHSRKSVNSGSSGSSVLGWELIKLEHELLEISIDSQWLDAIIVTIESVIFNSTISEVHNCAAGNFEIHCPPVEMTRRTQTIAASPGIRQVYRLQARDFYYSQESLGHFLTQSIEHLEIQIGFKNFRIGKMIELWFSRYPSKSTFSVFAKVPSAIPENVCEERLKMVTGMEFHKE